jgi:hypothetical protein
LPAASADWGNKSLRTKAATTQLRKKPSFIICEIPHVVLKRLQMFSIFGSVVVAFNIIVNT